MTSPDKPDSDSDAGDSDVQEVLSQYGVKSPRQLDKILKKHRSREFFDVRQEDKTVELQSRIASMEQELAERKAEEDYGTGLSPDSKKLARELGSMRVQLQSVMSKLAHTDEDDELEPYMEQVRVEYPEIFKVSDPFKRLEMARRLARTLKAEAETGANARTSGQPNESARVHLTGGGAPVVSRSRTEEREFQDYQRKIKAAKSQGERDRLADEWAERHSERRL